jgi:cysteinyl-tRNA synthetase
LFEAVKIINLVNDKKESITVDDLTLLKATLSDFIFDVLGLENTAETEDNSEKLSGVVQLLIGIRNEARDNKDWALSDKIRDELQSLGIQLKDGKEGTSFSLN